MFLYQAPNGKQLLSRISEIGNNNFKVEYVPVTAGSLSFLLQLSRCSRLVLSSNTARIVIIYWCDITMRSA